jgi:hypothetical protein
MPTMTRFARPKGFCGAVFVALLATAVLAAANGNVAAQDSQAPGPPAAAAPAVPPQPPPAAQPGFLHHLKVWWDDSIALVDRGIKGTGGTVVDLNKKTGDVAKDVAKDAAAATQGAMKGALDVSKDAATTLMRLPNTRVVEVRERCEPAPNGAPDCVSAAVTACRGKGFNTGQPLDVRTGEKCDTTAALRAGQSPGKGECPIESVITRAVCQ